MTRKIMITEKDYAKLIELIQKEREFGSDDKKEHLKELESELSLAQIVPANMIPKGVITMNSKVLLRDMTSGEDMPYELVYPEEADLLEDKISILAPIGTAVLGFKEGSIINWRVPEGMVKLKVKKVLYQPEA